MGSKLKLGIVGCGDIAGFAAWMSRLIPQLTLAACCDINQERARAFARRHGIPQVFTQYEELLDKAGVEAVYLAVPHHLHAPAIQQAVERRLPVLVEKPLTRTLDEARQLVASLRQHPVKVGVNYQYRYDRGCYALARAVQAGQLGKIFSASVSVPWHRQQAYFDQAAWHKSIAQAGGGTLITQGSHFLDIVLWAIGEPPVAAMGRTAAPRFAVEVDTLAHGIVETRGGAQISIVSTMAAAVERGVVIELNGERGSAVYTNRPFPRVVFSGVRLRQAVPPQFGLHALHRSLAGFAHWVLEDRPFLIPAESALPVLAAVDAIYRSAHSDRLESIETM